MSIEPQTHNPSREMDVDGNQFCDCGDYYPCPTVILTDLIAELRDEVAHYPPDLFPPFTDDDPASQSRTVDRIAGVAMRHAWTRAGEMADRAEARLREVNRR